MKKIAMLIVAAVLVIASAMTVFADEEYTIYDAHWDTNYDAGTVHIRWLKCSKSTKYRVVIHRKALDSTSQAAGTQILEKTISGSKYDATSLIRNKGTGIYKFSITPVNSPSALDDMVVGDDLEIDSDFLSRIRGNSSSDDDYSPSPSVRNGWVQGPGTWRYVVNGSYVTNNWVLDKGFWYYLNRNGDMLTGWQWINGRCYYLTPIQGLGGYPLGACWMGRTTPDGYTVNANGEWTIGNNVQVRY